jgi:peptide-methionine (S)-S-oxide reductase
MKTDSYNLNIVMWLVVLAAVIVFAFMHSGIIVMANNESETISDTKSDPNESSTEKNETATFAAGCFWGVEAAFRKVEGVKYAIVGYTGGRFKNPTYKDVCSGKTGHAEAVQITYDPNVISYEKLLEVFWLIHDPTTRNRQGPDVGTQYRSAIFFHTSQQAVAARSSKAKHQRKIMRRIVTEIKPAVAFYKAEEYHQRYIEKRKKASCPSSSK